MVDRYYYPEDIIKNKDGTVSVGYKQHLSENGEVFFKSDLEVSFTKEELQKIDDLYFQIWENARLRDRAEKIRAWMWVHYPEYMYERDSWYEYVSEVGVENASLSRFKVWFEQRGVLDDNCIQRI